MKTICIAGKNDIAVDVLRYCMDHYPGFRILCITNRTETGVNSWQRSFQFFAQQHSIPICTLEDVYDTEDLIFLSAEFDRLIRPDKFRSQELYNIHFPEVFPLEVQNLYTCLPLLLLESLLVAPRTPQHYISFGQYGSHGIEKLFLLLRNDFYIFP